MGNKIEITKQYRSTSPKAGIIETDTVEVEGGADGAARFVSRINANPRHEFEIIDYNVKLVTKLEGPRIIKNPTGGGTGKLIT